MNSIAILLLGSNLGNPHQNLENAISFLIQKGIKVLETSSIYESPAWGYASENTFYNMAVSVEPSSSADALLKTILEIEISMGRERNFTDDSTYSDRLIDIDILTFGNEVLDLEDLQIPHPRLPLRRFALEPLSELQPHWVHPITKKDISYLLQNCPDTSVIIKQNFI
jgi:2-amino-4-hydroxy-6-hydroxymethyldihydropteridine diphosphokinase